MKIEFSDELTSDELTTTNVSGLIYTHGGVKGFGQDFFASPEVKRSKGQMIPITVDGLHLEIDATCPREREKVFEAFPYAADLESRPLWDWLEDNQDRLTGDLEHLQGLDFQHYVVAVRNNLDEDQMDLLDDLRLECNAAVAAGDYEPRADLAHLNRHLVAEVADRNISTLKSNLMVHRMHQRLTGKLKP